jgi:hypothetical protein
VLGGIISILRDVLNNGKYVDWRTRVLVPTQALVGAEPQPGC